MIGEEIIVEINKRAAPNKRPAWNSGQKQLLRNTHTLWQDVKKLLRQLWVSGASRRSHSIARDSKLFKEIVELMSKTS